MRCQGKNVLQTFQKGILISIKSTQELFKHLNEKYNISYIVTHRLNRDSLESFFSVIRSRGGLNDHPTPLNAMYRIRIIVLGKNPGVVQAKQNIEIQNDQSNLEEYLVANVMATADVKIDLNNEEIMENYLIAVYHQKMNLPKKTYKQQMKKMALYIYAAGLPENLKTNIHIWETILKIINLKIHIVCLVGIIIYHLEV